MRLHWCTNYIGKLEVGSAGVVELAEEAVVAELEGESPEAFEEMVVGS